MNGKHHIACGMSLLLAALTAGGCFSVRETRDKALQQVRMGQYETAAPALEDLAARNRGGVDEAYWALWSGSACLFLGHAQKAWDFFKLAEWRFHDYDDAPFTEKTGKHLSWVAVNDCLLPYHPIGNDRIFLNLYKGLIAGSQGDSDAARVEFNRVRQRQYNYLYDRRRLAERLRQEAGEKEENRIVAAAARDQWLAQSGQSQSGVTGGISVGNVSPENDRYLADLHTRQQNAAIQNAPPPLIDHNRLRPLGLLLNPYAAHLCGLFRWLNGDRSLGDLEMAAALSDNPFFLRDASEAAAGAPPPARTAWVYVEDGLAPHRVEQRLDLPLGLFGVKPAYTGFAVPRIVAGRPAFGAYAVGGQSLARICDVENLICCEFKEDFKLILTREIIRVAVKTAAQTALIIAGEERRQHQKDRGESTLDGDLIKAGGYALGLYQAMTTAADVRDWSLLPKNVYAARVGIPADNILTLTAGAAAFQIRLPPCANAIVWVRQPAQTMRTAYLILPFGAP